MCYSNNWAVEWAPVCPKVTVRTVQIWDVLSDSSACGEFSETYLFFKGIGWDNLEATLGILYPQELSKICLQRRNQQNYCLTLKLFCGHWLLKTLMEAVNAVVWDFDQHVWSASSPNLTPKVSGSSSVASSLGWDPSTGVRMPRCISFSKQCPGR